MLHDVYPQRRLLIKLRLHGRFCFVQYQIARP